MKMLSRSIPADMVSLWEMNRASFGDTESAMRVWFELSSRAQEQAKEFVSSRWAKDAAALAQLGQCKTPVDALNLQVTYLRGVYADYLHEGQRIVGLFGDIIRETLPGISAEQAPSMTAKAKHSAHRVPTH
jgi:hypothetical protein